MDKRVDEVGSRQALVAALTARERQVLALRARGHSIAEIAAALVIEQRTVKFHLTNIYAKLSIDQRSYGARQLALACFAEVLDPAASASAAQVLGPPLRQEARNVAALTDIPPSAGGAGQPVPWEPVLTAAFTRPHGYKIDDYLSRGGYEALRKVLREMAPADVIKVVTDSKLVGRGGAGFSTGLKWNTAASSPAPRYLVVNADESEPGTFGNRYCMDADPHGLLEGMLICCYAVDIQQAYIYSRSENLRGYERLDYAIKQAYEKGFLGRDIAGKSGFNVEMAITRGAGAYICGEETALMESFEGRRPQPRVRPPFPADLGGGLYGRPTVVNNVETLMDVPHIITRGPEWFAGIGNPASPGPKVYTISGHVNKPGVYELPTGVTLRNLIYTYAGGMQRDQAVKAVSPGALACQIIPGTNLDITMDTATLTRPPHFNKMGPVGFGAGGIIVYGEETNMVDLMVQVSGFFARESCGKCVPCREGTHWMLDTWRRIQAGDGRLEDLALLEDVASSIGPKKTLCTLGDFAAGPVWSAIQHFRPEFEDHIRRNVRLRPAAASPVTIGRSLEAPYGQPSATAFVPA